MDKVTGGANIYLVIITYILMAVTAYLTFRRSTQKSSG